MLNKLIFDDSILSFHRISRGQNNNNSVNSSLNSLTINKKDFEKQIVTLKKYFNIIDLNKILNSKLNSKKRNIVLTFDDGYKDNLTNALPILRKYKVPATIYITTRFLQNKCNIWWYEIEKFISKNSQLKFKFLDKSYSFSLKSKKNKKRCFEILSSLFKELNYNQQNNLLRKITKKGNRTQYKKELLSKQDLIFLNKNYLITIGAHTHNHISLTCLNNKDSILELKKSKKILENLLKKKVYHFAYPYGSKKDATLRESNLVKKVKFKSAVTTQIQFHKIKNKFLIPRLHINSKDQGIILLLKLSWLYKIYQMIKGKF